MDFSVSAGFCGDRRAPPIVPNAYPAWLAIIVVARRAKAPKFCRVGARPAPLQGAAKAWALRGVIARRSPGCVPVHRKIRKLGRHAGFRGFDSASGEPEPASRAAIPARTASRI